MKPIAVFRRGFRIPGLEGKLNALTNMFENHAASPRCLICQAIGLSIPFRDDEATPCAIDRKGRYSIPPRIRTHRSAIALRVFLLDGL
jgi:hypothetical protein